jgi:uroporphyrinogen-III decarboxylase
MGFEEALIAMIMEPEASYELLSALTDYRIEFIKYCHKYYNPDIYIYFDDVATERYMTISLDTYRSLIKPLHTKIVDACKELGIIPVQHTCGKADVIVQDMIDEGNEAWHAVQATNDIEDIIQKHGDYFVIMGGYNSNGAPGMENASEDVVRAEVRRCMDTYAKYGKGYIFMGMVMSTFNPENPFDMGPLNGVIIDEFLKIRAEQEALA